MPLHTRTHHIYTSTRISLCQLVFYACFAFLRHAVMSGQQTTFFLSHNLYTIRLPFTASKLPYSFNVPASLLFCTVSPLRCVMCTYSYEFCVFQIFTSVSQIYVCLRLNFVLSPHANVQCACVFVCSSWLVPDREL